METINKILISSHNESIIVPEYFDRKKNMISEIDIRKLQPEKDILNHIFLVSPQK